LSATESDMTRTLCRALEERGALVKAHAASRMNAPGWPDRWVCHRLWHGHLEMKRGDEPLTPLQRRRAAEIDARQPGTVFVVRLERGGPESPCAVFATAEAPDGRVVAAVCVEGDGPLELLRALADDRDARSPFAARPGVTASEEDFS
jgi:hypothetical protein